MKKIVLIFAMFLLIFSAKAQSFYANCETGQSLLFGVIDKTSNKVAIMGTGTEKPTGKVVLPSIVEHNGQSYEVVEIKMGSFSGCNEMTSLTISKTINKINLICFDSFRNLEEIIVDPENEVYDSRDNCNAIIVTADNELVYGCKNAFIPNTVVSIDWYAFRGSGLTAITIPESVKVIRCLAFYDCLITELFIPSTVERIEYEPWDAERVTATLEGTDLKLEAGTYYFVDEYDEHDLAYGVVVVPCGMRETYENSPWGKFLPIREDCKE